MAMCDRLLKAQKGLFIEENRRATFKTWIFDNKAPCSADKMAEAGFIFTGSSREPDSVQCFFCGKSLDGWEQSDNPWFEHLKHASFCEFAKMQKPQATWLLKEYLDILQKYEENLGKHLFDKLTTDVKNLHEISRNDIRLYYDK